MSPSTGNIPSNHRGATLLPSGVPIGDSLIVPRAPSKAVSLRNQLVLGRQRFLPAARPVSSRHSRITPRPPSKAGQQLSPSAGNISSNHRGSALLPSCAQVGDSLIVPCAPSKAVSLRNQRLLGSQRFLPAARPVSPGHSRIAPRPPDR